MKNLINKVFVVLAVSALFAGSIDASQGGGRKRTYKSSKEVSTTEVSTAPTAKEAIEEEVKAIAGMQVLDRIEKLGHIDIAKKYSVALRQADIDAFKELTDNAKHIEAVENFLLGTDKGNTKEIRGKYKNSAIAAVKAVREKAVTEQIATTKASVEKAKEDKTPEALADAQNQVGILTKMYNYLPTAKQTAAITAIGVTVAALASLGVDYSSSVAFGTTGLKYAGQAYEGAKLVPGGLASGAQKVGGAVWNGTKWVASTAYNFPWTAAAALGSMGKSVTGYFSSKPITGK